MYYEQRIIQTGSIATVDLNQGTKIVNKVATVDDFTAKITTLFLPYIDMNITDRKLLELQDRLKKELEAFGKSKSK